jgi:hypothetical protein
MSVTTYSLTHYQVKNEKLFLKLLEEFAFAEEFSARIIFLIKKTNFILSKLVQHGG